MEYDAMYFLGLFYFVLPSECHWWVHLKMLGPLISEAFGELNEKYSENRWLHLPPFNASLANVSIEFRNCLWWLSLR
jgi:hypothetical protein